MTDGRFTVALTFVLAIFLIASIVDGQHQALAADCSPLAPCPPAIPNLHGCDTNEAGLAGCLAIENPANPSVKKDQGSGAPASVSDAAAVTKACESDRAAHAKPEICACIAQASVGNPSLSEAWLAEFTGMTPSKDENQAMAAILLECNLSGASQ